MTDIPISIEVPCCWNCNKGYFDETSCFMSEDCPNPECAGHGFVCENYEGSVSFKDLRDWSNRDIIRRLEMAIKSCDNPDQEAAYDYAISIMRGD